MTEWIKDRMDRLANPLLVKEMYQSVHSKKFLAALWLLLGGALFTYAVVYLSRPESGECGGHMFAVFGTLTYLMALCVLPYLGFSNLYQEVEGRTIELVHITAITSARQVRGRLMAALTKVALLYAVVGPFAVTAFLFKGVGIEAIAFVLGLILIFSVPACALGIWFGALTSSKHIRVIARWGYVLVVGLTLFYGMVFGLASAQSFFFGFGMGGGPDLETIFITLGVSAPLALLATWFLCASAANILTFEADKCSGKTKLVLLVIVAAAFAAPVAVDALAGTGMDDEIIITLGVLTTLFAALWCFFWATDKRRVSRSLERKLERRGILYRLALFPFVDGPGSGLAYSCIAFALIMVGTTTLAWQDLWDWQMIYVAVPLMGLVYVLFFLALTQIVMRFLPGKWRTTLARRIVAAVVVVFNVVISTLMLAGVTDHRWWDRMAMNPGMALSPVLYLRAAGDAVIDGDGAEYLLPLILPLGIGLAVCLISATRHFRRYMRGDYN